MLANVGLGQDVPSTVQVIFAANDEALALPRGYVGESMMVGPVVEAWHAAIYALY